MKLTLFTVSSRLAVFLLFFLFATSLHAGHIVGGEVSYTCDGWLNNDPNSGVRRYTIKINMYRDCIGDGAYFDGLEVGQAVGPGGLSSSPGHITIYRGTQRFIPTFSILLDSADDVPVNLGNPCLVLTEPVCQQVGVYEFPIELPVSDEAYTITYQRCCRNEAIINLISPESIGTTYSIEITPKAQLECNASPRFNIDPPIAICVNEEFRIDLGATDREGDSLVYKFCDPVVGGGRDGRMQTATTFDDVVPLIESPPPYQAAAFRLPQYSVTQQLGRNSTLEIDPLTGQLFGIPSTQGTFALAVCVEEWSQDSIPVLLSTTKREFQLTVNLCGNQVFADLEETSLDDLGRFFIQQCGPGENTIINQSTNVNFIDQYSWTLDGPEGIVTGTGRNFTTFISTTGVYNGTMILNRDSEASNCRDTAEFMLGVFPDTEVDFEFTTPGCDDEPIDFTNLSRPLGDNTITAYSWDFADGSAGDSRPDARHQYQIPGNFSVVLTTTDNNNCSASASKPLSYFPSPRTILIEPDEGFGCAPFTKPFVNLSRPIDDSYTFEWDFGDGNTGDEASPTHIYENRGVYDVYLGITSPAGCFVDTTFTNLVDVRDAPEADFVWSPDEPSNLLPDVQFFDRSVGANRRRYVVRNRQGAQLFTTPLDDFEFRLRDTSSIFVTQFVTHPSGCIDSIVKDLRLRIINTYHLPDAFTPNGDGLNDVFAPVGLLNGISDYRLRIWTRFGENIFTATDANEVWDGTYKGTQSPAGGYLWDAEFTDINGDPKKFKGGVVLIR